jgi:Tfp pilus assembly protein PilF
MARALRFRIVEGERPLGRRRPDDPETYNLYLKAVVLGDQFPTSGTAAAKKAFEEVIRRAPGFAPGYAGLANTLVMEPFMTPSAPRENLQRALGLASKAIDLDPSYAEAHAVMAHAYFNSWKWREAERKFQDALRLDPDSAVALQLYSIYLATQRRFEEALLHIRRASGLSPTSGLIAYSECIIQYHAGNFKEAESVCRKTLELDPGRSSAHQVLARAYSMQGMHAEARRNLDMWTQNFRDPVTPKLWRAYYLARSGEIAKAREILVNWESDPLSKAMAPPLAFALAKLALGDRRGGFDALNKAVDGHVAQCVWLKATPELERYRQGDDYRTLMAKFDAQ